MQSPPSKRFVFRIKYDTGSVKKVVVYDWNRGGAWATICRDLNKSDHGDSRTVCSITFTAEGVNVHKVER